MLKTSPGWAQDQQIVSPGTYREVAAVVWDYVAAMGNPDQAQDINGLLSPIWNGKFATKDGLKVYDKAGLQAALNTGEASFGPGRYELTSIQVYYGDFAMARLDNRKAAEVSYLTLFRNNGFWQMTGEVRVGAGVGVRHPHFSPDNSTDEVLKVMDTYYRAVELGKPTWLEAVFHADWHMKNPEDGKIVSEDKKTFIARLQRGPSEGYYDDRQVSDVQIMFDCMAVVRVDNPSTQSTTMFTYIKLEDEWVMVDKAWSFPIASAD